MAKQLGRTSLAILLVAVAATGFWSCGGSAEGPTSPVALLESPAAAVSGPVDGGVTASAKGKITICHEGRNKQVPPSALGGHLGHGDRLGACAPAARRGLPLLHGGRARRRGRCSAPRRSARAARAAYSLSLFCAPGGGGGTVGNLGLLRGASRHGHLLDDDPGPHDRQPGDGPRSRSLRSSSRPAGRRSSGPPSTRTAARGRAGRRGRGASRPARVLAFASARSLAAEARCDEPPRSPAAPCWPPSRRRPWSRPRSTC